MQHSLTRRDGYALLKQPKGIFFLRFFGGRHADTPRYEVVCVCIYVHTQYFEGLSCSISVNKLIEQWRVADLPTAHAHLWLFFFMSNPLSPLLFLILSAFLTPFLFLSFRKPVIEYFILLTHYRISLTFREKDIKCTWLTQWELTLP